MTEQMRADDANEVQGYGYGLAGALVPGVNVFAPPVYPAPPPGGTIGGDGGGGSDYSGDSGGSGGSDPSDTSWDSPLRPF